LPTDTDVAVIPVWSLKALDGIGGSVDLPDLPDEPDEEDAVVAEVALLVDEQAANDAARTTALIATTALERRRVDTAPASMVLM
jgi:hypothetical protein